MARITIKNFTKENLTFGRSSGTFHLAPGKEDFFHIHGGKVFLVNPVESNEFQAVEGDRYIVFNDQDNMARFAYIGKDGRVSEIKKHPH